MKEIGVINPEAVTEDEAVEYSLREAARAVVFDSENNVALLHSTVNKYYKLPGGGIESGEDPILALKRECLEEIGCDIDSIEEVGIVREYRKRYNLKQLSYSYTANVVGEKGVVALTEDEIAEGFVTVWVTLPEAIKLITESSIETYPAEHMTLRDKTILEAITL